MNTTPTSIFTILQLQAMKFTPLLPWDFSDISTALAAIILSIKWDIKRIYWAVSNMVEHRTLQKSLEKCFSFESINRFITRREHKIRKKENEKYCYLLCSYFRCKNSSEKNFQRKWQCIDKLKLLAHQSNRKFRFDGMKHK